MTAPQSEGGAGDIELDRALRDMNEQLLGWVEANCTPADEALAALMESVRQQALRFAAEAARVCHEANRALQAITGDASPSVPWDAETPETRETAVAGVLAALDGATPEELHAGWCRMKAAQGWRRGEFKDAEAKTHPCLVPYGELPEAQRVKDRVFAAIVQAMATPETQLPECCASGECDGP